MKHIITILLTFLAISLSAQEQEKEVTQFMGIPVDETKSEMIQKLNAKGYKYNSITDLLEGKFNGQDVGIAVVTNNNKVYRIYVVDRYYLNETDIVIRFNTLCNQFENNSKYFGSLEQRIPDNDDIWREINIHNKRYEAVFYQTHFGDKLEDAINRPVWFMIREEYDKYKICMYYDNVYNQPNGEDL